MRKRAEAREDHSIVSPFAPKYTYIILCKIRPMKFNPLVSSIFRGAWLIKPEIALNYGAVLADIFAGDPYSDDREPIGAYAMSPEGMRIDIEDTPAEGQTSVFDAAPGGSTAFVPVKGVMMKEDTLSHYGTGSISRVVMEAGIHKNIGAVVLEIDSGGGSVDSVGPMIDAIRFAQKRKPVLSWSDLAASAAYWTASATDLVIAQNDISPEFGSIGVMMSFADIRPMWEREGVKFHTIYAPESNYKNLPFEKALKGDYDLIRSEELSPLARKFQKEVRSNRRGKVDITQPGILNGRTFFARDAVRHGLADEIGNREYAIKRAAELAKKHNQ